MPQTISLPFGTFRQWRRAIALAAFLTCLTIVWFWPRSASAHGVLRTSIFFLIAALAVAGLTYWHPVRVQIGRRRLRYKAVRYRAFRIALVYSIFIGSWAIALWLTPNSKNPTGGSTPETITVTITRLPGDSDNRLQEDLQRALASLSAIGINSASIAQSEAPRGAVPGFFEHENAESCLRAAHGDLLLWGKANGATGEAALYETGLDEWMQFGATFTPHDFKLPELPPGQLIPVVKLMVAVQSFTFHLGNLSSLAAILPSLIAPVRAITDSNSASSSPDTRARLNYIVSRALMLQGSLLWQDTPIRSSIAYCLTAIALWPTPAYNSERGMVLDSLTQALRLLGLVGNDVAALAEAARAATAAAALYSPESDPLDRAAMLQQTGQTMRLLASNGHPEALPRALAAFQAAAQVFTQESYPEQWASLQDDIGMTEAALALRTPGTEHLRAAIDAFNQALTVRTRARSPWEWAITQQLLGHALITLGERDPSSGGDAQAVACDRSALEVLTAENDPDDWSNAEIDLGTALGSIGEARGQADQMLEAADQMRAGATARLRQRDPAAWVNAQAALSSTLNQLGQLEWRQERGDEHYASQLDRSAQQHFDESVAAARAGLTAVSEHEAPNMWGYLQDEQASVLEEIGSREAANHDNDDAVYHLREAVAADRAALHALNVTEAPDNWADAQHDLGDSLTDLSDFEPDSSDLQQAVTAYRNAMTIETLARSPDYWAPIQNSLGLALEKLGLRTHGNAGMPYLQQAIDAFRAAEQVSTPDNDLDSWLTTQAALARTDAELGDRENGTAHLEQAAEAYRDELKYLSPARSPSAWKDASDHLNGVLGELRMRQAAS
jgi:tetratricopeptide (TPR) repeat protein